MTGLDSGPRRWAISTALTAFETPLCDGVDRKQATIRCLQREMDRSLRAMNPDTYDDQGRAKKGKVWKKSAGYLKTQEKLCELERKKTAQRRSVHGHLSNRVRRTPEEAIGAAVSPLPGLWVRHGGARSAGYLVRLQNG